MGGPIVTAKPPLAMNYEGTMTKEQGIDWFQKFQIMPDLGALSWTGLVPRSAPEKRLYVIVATAHV